MKNMGLCLCLLLPLPLPQTLISFKKCLTNLSQFCHFYSDTFGEPVLQHVLQKKRKQMRYLFCSFHWAWRSWNYSGDSFNNFLIQTCTCNSIWALNYHPASKASKEVANLTERKNLHN